MCSVVQFASLSLSESKALDIATHLVNARKGTVAKKNRILGSCCQGGEFPCDRNGFSQTGY